MLSDTEAKSRLLSILRAKSVAYGEFLLSSGGKSNYYIDCRLTTLDAEGAILVGQVMHAMIQVEAKRRGVQPQAVGGLTMGADPISLSVSMQSFRENPSRPLQCFTVRKTPKAHGQTKLIEGNFKSGDLVVAIDDVVTKGDSTLAAISAVEKEGGKVAFAAVLVDRQEGGRQKIEQDYPVIAAFTREDLIDPAKVAEARAKYQPAS